jgi:type I restriction enzyme M protein
VLTSETKRRIDSCRDILVGKLPLPTDQVELITLALIYKFMDDLDEESVAMGGKRSFFTGALAPYRWSELMRQTVSADERMARFADGLELLGGAKKLRDEKNRADVDVAAHLPPLFRDIFRNAFLKFRDGRILTLFLTELGGFAYSHSEELGNAFEYILQCMGAQGDNGQFRTPRHIIDFIVACLDPQPTDRILDPACGTGGFLVSAFKHILGKNTSPGSTLPGDRLSHDERQRLYANFTGYDTNDQMVKLSRVNLFLHQFATPTVHIYDTLTNDARWHEKADVILANPPFMTPKGGVVPHTRFRIPAKKSEVLFTDYIAEHLTPDGRAGVIVPNGIVATTQNAYVKLRRFLIEDSLVAVVSLPAGCFKPYSGVKTSILFLDKKLARSTDKILFLKIAADGFDLGDKRTPIEANDLPEAERMAKAWFNGKLATDFEWSLLWKLIAKRELLTDLSVSLSPDRYFGEVDAFETECPKVPLGELCEILDSQRRPITKMDREGGSIPYYGATGIVDYVAGYIFDEPLVLVGEDGAKWGPNEKSAFPISGKTWVNNHAHVLRPDRARILDTYLIETLNVMDLMPFVSGVTVPKLNQANLRKIEIPLPPLEEQRRIVAEIEGYQQVIDGARQILGAYHIDIAPRTDWPTTTISEVAQFKNGVNYSKESHGTGIKVIGVRNFQDYLIAPLDDLDEINPEGVLSDGHVLEDGDLIFVRSNGSKELVGRCLLVQPNGERLTHSAFTIRMRLDRKRCVPKFYALLFRHPSFREQMFGGGANINNLSQDILKAIEIPLPPLPEQERIVAELDAEAARIEAVRGLIPAFEAKIQRVLARVWGNSN